MSNFPGAPSRRPISFSHPTNKINSARKGLKQSPVGGEVMCHQQHLFWRTSGRHVPDALRHLALTGACGSARSLRDELGRLSTKCTIRPGRRGVGVERRRNFGPLLAESHYFPRATIRALFPTLRQIRWISGNQQWARGTKRAQIVCVCIAFTNYPFNN